MKARILIADDDQVVRHLLTSALSASGYDVTSVASGGDCLTHLRKAVERGEDLPDLLLLDLQLMDMTGTEVLAEVRALSGEQRFPVVMLSANSRDEILQSHPGAADADGFLTKPFPMDQALHAVEAALQKS